VLFSLIAYTLIYAILMIIMIGLMIKYGKRSPDEIEKEETLSEIPNSVVNNL